MNESHVSYANLCKFSLADILFGAGIITEALRCVLQVKNLHHHIPL